MRLKNILFLVISFWSVLAFAQNAKVDSLKALLDNFPEDTARVNILNAISNSIFSSSPDEAIEYGTQAKELAQELHDSTGLAYALKNIGLGYYIYGNYVEVSLHWEKSLEIFELINDDLGSANLLSNLGVVYANQGKDDKAINNYLKSLRISEKLADSLRIASALGNIGFVYSGKPATRNLALEYFWQGLAIAELIEDLDIVHTITYDIGDIYFHKKEYDSALIYLEKSLTVVSNTVDAATSLNLIGSVYAEKGDYQLAVDFHLRAIEIASSFEAKFDLAESLLGLADTYKMMGETSQAIKAYKKAQLIAEEVGADYKLKEIYGGLANSYASMSDFKNAFIYQQLFDVVKDSIYTVETDDKIKTLQFHASEG